MAEITAGMVKELREKTDAPMMECKKALAEANGDAGRAEEILRIRLGNRASRAATRVTAEGVVSAHIALDGKAGTLIEVNCETDFVAKNDEFLSFAHTVAELVTAHNPPDVGILSGLAAGGGTVDEMRRALIGRIGENVTISRFARIPAKGRLAQYVHGGAKIGVLVDVTDGDELLGRDLAMHIAFAKPLAVSPSQVPAALIEKERNIAAAKAADSGKPANIVAKIVEGGVQKYLKEVTLLEQPFVKNEKQTIEQLLKSKGAAVAGFALLVVSGAMSRVSQAS